MHTHTQTAEPFARSSLAPAVQGPLGGILTPLALTAWVFQSSQCSSGTLGRYWGPFLEHQPLAFPRHTHTHILDSMSSC